MARALIVVVNRQTKQVPFWTVTTDYKADPLLDRLRLRFKSPEKFEPENGDLADDLWVEDDVYDYLWLLIGKNEKPEDIFRQNNWRIKLDKRNS